MKKNLFRTLLIAAIVLSVAFVSSCDDGGSEPSGLELINSASFVSYLTGSSTDSAYLSTDITVSELITIAADKTKTVDLNGHTVTFADFPSEIGNYATLITNNGSLTLKNGTIATTASCVCDVILNKGTLNANALKINAALVLTLSKNDVYAVFNEGTGASATLENGCEVSISATGANAKVTGIFNKNASIVFKDSTVITKQNTDMGTYAFYSYVGADINDDATAQITNSTIKAETSKDQKVVAVFAESYSTSYQAIVNVSGGTVNAKSYGSATAAAIALRAKGNSLITLRNSVNYSAEGSSTNTDKAYDLQSSTGRTGAIYEY